MYAESYEQAAVVDRLHRDPRFSRIPWFGSPNAQKRTLAQQRVAKMLGMRAGVPDLLFLAFERAGKPLGVAPRSGLALEFKNPNGKGKISDEQQYWAQMLREEGWRVEFPITKEEAWAIICDYFAIAS